MEGMDLAIRDVLSGLDNSLKNLNVGQFVTYCLICLVNSTLNDKKKKKKKDTANLSASILLVYIFLFLTSCVHVFRILSCILV